MTNLIAQQAFREDQSSPKPGKFPIDLGGQQVHNRGLRPQEGRFSNRQRRIAGLFVESRIRDPQQSKESPSNHPKRIISD